MDAKNLPIEGPGDNYEARRRREIEWRWEEPTADQLRGDLLEPYRTLAEDGHPFGPVAREILDDPEPDAHLTFRRCLDLWTESALAFVQELDRPTTERGRQAMLTVLANRYPQPLHPARRRELAGQGVAVELTALDRWEATWTALVRARDRVEEETLGDLPHSLMNDSVLRNELNEVATAVLAGKRDRRSGDRVSLNTVSEGDEDTEVSRQLIQEIAAQEAAADEAAVLARADIKRLEARLPDSLQDDLRVLLDVVRDEGRLNTAEAARRLGVSRPTIIKRISRISEYARSA